MDGVMNARACPRRASRGLAGPQPSSLSPCRGGCARQALARKRGARTPARGIATRSLSWLALRSPVKSHSLGRPLNALRVAPHRSVRFVGQVIRVGSVEYSPRETPRRAPAGRRLIRRERVPPGGAIALRIRGLPRDHDCDDFVFTGYIDGRSERIVLDRRFAQA